MDNSRLDRVEDMFTQLIKVVGETNELVRGMRDETQVMKLEIIELRDVSEKRHQEFIEFRDVSEKRHQEFIEFKDVSEKRHQEFREFKDTSEKRHIEVMDRFDDIELDQDVIWNKSVENERKISRMMRFKS